MECQKVYLLTLQLHGIFYYIYVAYAMNFLTLRRIFGVHSLILIFLCSDLSIWGYFQNVHFFDNGMSVKKTEKIF